MKLNYWNTSPTPKTRQSGKRSSLRRMKILLWILILPLIMIWSGSTVNIHQRSHNQWQTAEDGKNGLSEFCGLMKKHHHLFIAINVISVFWQLLFHMIIYIPVKKLNRILKYTCDKLLLLSPTLTDKRLVKKKREKRVTQNWSMSILSRLYALQQSADMSQVGVTPFFPFNQFCVFSPYRVFLLH